MTEINKGANAHLKKKGQDASRTHLLDGSIVSIRT